MTISTPAGMVTGPVGKLTFPVTLVGGHPSSKLKMSEQSRSELEELGMEVEEELMEVDVEELMGEDDEVDDMG